jgi:hypothetical protein
MVATSRFREYMPFDIRSDATRLSVESPRASVWVPSSSPPPAPAIRYIVPTFGWRTSHDGKRLWRSGGGLRVWLDRPWFGSGANEMLAVLLPRGTDDPQLSDAKNYVSQWGADPVWRGRNIASIAPPRSAFSRAVNAGPVPVLFAPPTGNPDPAVDGQNPPAFYPIESLLPQGAPAGLRVDAVPHAVGYDSDRQLWYCDIVINPGESYFPFVRLALVRYQPASLPDMHLSSVAMASFQQLAPDRVATVIPIGTSRVRVEVRGHGDPPRDGEPLTFSPVPTTGRVDIRLQRLKAGQDESLDWQDTAKGARPEVPNPTEDRPRVQSKAGSARMSTRMQTRIATARRQLEAGDFSVFDTDPSIIDLLLPPLLLDQVVQLPRHGRDRLRILVTEREEHLLIDDDGRSTDKRATRIVYTAAIEV